LKKNLKLVLKTGDLFIFRLRILKTCPEFCRKQGGKMMMHEQGMQHDYMLMRELWDMLTDEQKKTLLKRKLDGKIMAKEEMIRHFQYKIETLKMVKTMLDECS